MPQYNFYYDESEHSRKINLDTVSAENYYDSFIAVIAGWRSLNEKAIFDKYSDFEEKYKDRKSKGELKSLTLKPDQFENGFASMNKHNVIFLNDFLSLFNEEFYIYFSVTSKFEYIINQLFKQYENSIFADMDAMKYSIVKAILVYRPKEIIEEVFEDTGELAEKLKKFLNDRIQQNEKNQALKKLETKSFKEILLVLDDISIIKKIDWNYDIAFLGFKKYIQELAINDFTLTLDQEGGNSKTLHAAKKTGFESAIEIDSKLSIGVRISDMLAGIISKLLKALHNSLQYSSPKEELKKKVLKKEWFILNQKQLEMYKNLYSIICKFNNAWYKTFAGNYSDDLVLLIALLNFMNSFSTVEELKEKDINMQGEYFNAYSCKCLEEHFKRMKNKLPISPMLSNDKDYFFNQKGAKVFVDAHKQPLLKFINNTCKCNVLSVGFSKDRIPLVTIMQNNKPICHRLPDDLRDWAITMVAFANQGMNLFPNKVIFTQRNGKFFADIL